MYAAAGNPRRTPPSGKKTIYGWTRPNGAGKPTETGSGDAMERLEELIRILSEPETRARHSKAKTTRTCKICGCEALHFRDAASAFEYSVSAICQECQDKYLCAGNRQAG